MHVSWVGARESLSRLFDVPVTPHMTDEMVKGAIFSAPNTDLSLGGKPKLMDL